MNKNLYGFHPAQDNLQAPANTGGLAQFLSQFFASNNNGVRSNASARQNGGAHLGIPSPVFSPAAPLPNAQMYQGNPNANPNIGVADNTPQRSNSQFMSTLLDGLVGSSNIGVADNTPQRSNSQFMSTLVDDLVGSSKVGVADDTPRRSNSQFMSTFVDDLVAPTPKKNTSSKKKSAPKKKTAKPKASAPKKNDIQAKINNSAGVVTHADRLAMLSPHYVNDDEYGLTY